MKSGWRNKPCCQRVLGLPQSEQRQQKVRSSALRARIASDARVVLEKIRWDRGDYREHHVGRALSHVPSELATVGVSDSRANDCSIAIVKFFIIELSNAKRH